MRPNDVTLIVAIFLSPSVIADNFIILPEDDISCNRTDRQHLHSLITVDDVVLHEQLTLQWYFVGNRTASNGVTQIRRLVGACSGIVIRPSGRFVSRMLSDGLVSFWLLRAEVQFECPMGFTNPDEYYVHIEQWIETNSWRPERHRPASFHNTYDQDTSPPVAYNSVPDKISQLNCSGGKRTVREHLAGYIRRLRVSWKLNGALSQTSPELPTPPGELPVEDKKRWKNSTWNFLHNRRPLHPDFGFNMRFTSRMLFEGNLNSDRKRVLCEFFSGFWCNSIQPDVVVNLLSPSDRHRSLAEPDQEACVPATMRCDRLADCDLSLTEGELMNRSADEAYCNALSGKYSFGQSDQPTNLTLSDRWSSRLPWIVLAPVPLVLVCALVRICSQKRLLDLDDEAGVVSGFDHEADHFHATSNNQKVSQNTKGSTTNERGLTRTKARNLWRGVFYGPVTTLSSVAEVDELDTDIRSHLSDTASKSMDGSFVTGGSALPPHGASIHSSDQLMMGRNPDEAVFVTDNTNRSNQSLHTIHLEANHHHHDHHRLSGMRKLKTGRQIYLCLSAIFNSSSSSSSSSSASHSSPCSGCSVSHKYTTETKRSQSCGELHLHTNDNLVSNNEDLGVEMQNLRAYPSDLATTCHQSAGDFPSSLQNLSSKSEWDYPLDRCNECLVHAVHSVEQLDGSQGERDETVHIRSFSQVDYISPDSHMSKVGAGHRPSDPLVSDTTEITSLPNTSSTTALLDNESLLDMSISKD